MFSFDPPENIRTPLVFNKRENWGEKGLNQPSKFHCLINFLV